MANKKKQGFLLYLDNYPWVRVLELEQKGLLLDSLFRFAIALNEREITAESFLPQLPEMDGKTIMAFCFMADAIYRDHRKWYAAQETREAKRLERILEKREERLAAQEYRGEIRNPCGVDLAALGLEDFSSR